MPKFFVKFSLETTGEIVILREDDSRVAVFYTYTSFVAFKRGFRDTYPDHSLYDLFGNKCLVGDVGELDDAD